MQARTDVKDVVLKERKSVKYDACDNREEPFGALYVVNACPYQRAMLSLSKRSLVRTASSIPIETRYIDSPVGIGDSIRWYLGSKLEKKLRRTFKYIWPEATYRAFAEALAQKARTVIHCPFERTVYLDTDTFVVGDISRHQKWLNDGYEAVVQAPRSYSVSGDWLGEIGSSKPMLNSGVYLYTPAFAQRLKTMTEKVTQPLESVWLSDQVIFSATCYKYLDKVKLVDDLQMDNAPTRLKYLKCSNQKQMVKSILDGEGGASVFHYIYNKRIVYAALNNMSMSRNHE